MEEAFQQVLTQAIEDEAFSRRLQENFDETIKPYNLSAEEVAALQALQPQILEALRQREQVAAGTRAWYTPANFREAGAAILSTILVLLLFYAAWATFSQVDVAPLTYDVNGNVQVVDSFDRAKDLLNIFFPLFGAVVTFWLGVTVEGRRADQNEAEAEQAKVEKEAAEDEAKETNQAAAAALDEAESAVLEQMGAVGSGFERSGGEAAQANQAALQNAMRAIHAGRQKLAR